MADNENPAPLATVVDGEDNSPREDSVNPSSSDILYQDYKAHEESLCHTLNESHINEEAEFHGLGSGPLELSAELCGRLSRSASIEFDHSKPVSLDTLPPELFLCICDFLDAHIVIKTLSLVCRYFHEIVQEDITWKLRIAKRLHGKVYPAVPVEDSTFDWKNACISIEEQDRMWRNKNHLHFTLSEGIYASVDAVHLMKDATMMATGSRDRNLNIWDLTKLDDSNPSRTKQCLVHTTMKAHKGWIWSLRSLGTSLCSGSWDMWIKLWDMNEEVREVSSVKCKSAVLCMSYEENQILAGAFDSKLYFIDPRTAQITDIKRIHSRPVLCLAADDKYVVTGGEDTKISIFNRRAHKVEKSLKLDVFPMSVSYGDRQLWVGDKSGCLHLFDATYGKFEKLQMNIDVGHTGKLTGIHHSQASIITCSTDKTVKVLSPTLDPHGIITLPAHAAEVAEVDFQNNVLVSACSAGSVGLWKPVVQLY